MKEEIIRWLGSIFWEIGKSISEICFLALLAWTMCLFMPHGLPFIDTVSYLGWVTIIFIAKVLAYKFNENRLVEASSYENDIASFQPAFSGIEYDDGSGHTTIPGRNIIPRDETLQYNDEGTNFSTRE